MKRILAAAALVLAGPVLAQEVTLTYAQVKSEYRQMSPVHIRKCDQNGDGLYGRAEMLCVSSIYQSFYLNPN